jgi:hypothetical protein
LNLGITAYGRICAQGFQRDFRVLAVFCLQARFVEMEAFHIEPEMASLLDDTCDEDLCSLLQLQEDPANDAQNELFIYICFLIFTRTDSMEYLARAIQRAEGWVAESANDHPDREQRLEILDKMTARMRECGDMLEDTGLPSDGTERSVTISLKFVPRRSLEYFGRRLRHKTDRQVCPRTLNDGGSITEV